MEKAEPGMTLSTNVELCVRYVQVSLRGSAGNMHPR